MPTSSTKPHTRHMTEVVTVLEPETLQRLEHAVRSLSTASRSLRLYPAASPIPRETVSIALTSLEQFFDAGFPVLSISLARDGFAFAGEPIAVNVSGAGELASELRAHGVAEIDFSPGVSADELLDFLTISARGHDEVRQEGGLAALAAAGGVEHVRVVDVQLTVVDTGTPADGEDYGDFLRELIADPAKLTTWLSAASAGDPAALEDGLIELMRASGTEDLSQFLDSLSSAFLSQSSDGRDALLGLSMDGGPVRELTGRVFNTLGAPDIAESILGGVFGKNMLSLSSALTSLPLEHATAQVRAEVQAMLPTVGHTPKEAAFLEHMLEVRGRKEAEQSLVDADRTFKAVMQAATLKDEDVARARSALTASAGVLGAASVRTMLSLLDQQQDFELYCAGADNLARMVPQLIEQGDLTLASRVLTELANRESHRMGPWPELSARLREAIAVAVGPRSMEALINAVVADRSLEPIAIQIVRHGGETCGAELVVAAINHKAVGLEVAEALVGRRIIDLLHVAAGSAQWFQLTPIVTRLAEEGDPRSIATIEALLARADEQSRREVATGLAGIHTPASVRLLDAALRDSSPEVSVVAARAIAKSGVPGSAALLARRLGELDVDTNDFLLARELITGLARIPEPAADEALAKLGSRRVLIKRGHFNEVQQLVARARSVRAGQEVAR